MDGLVRIPLSGGGAILVQEAAGEGPPGPVRAGRPLAELVQDAEVSLREALEPVRRAAEVTLSEFRRAAPDEVQVELGVVLTASAGAVLAKLGSECHLNVTLTWKASGVSGAVGD